MATFLIELSAPPAAVLDVQADLMRVQAIADAQAGSLTPTRLLHSAYVPARETCVSFMDGPDQETVCAVLAEAGLRARVLSAVALS
ncbi:MAG TPA: hypothetical protein VJ872_16175 [Nocardioides sp.]|nr:hypothetical protein [Nocardioides sp.]